MDTWTPTENVPPYLDEVVLTDLDLVAEITHPIRSRILHRLRRPSSAAELAADLDVPVTRLYHHLHRLEELGLIVVVATRRSGARTERRYRNRGRGFRIEADLTAPPAADVARVVTSLFDVARTELRREFDLGMIDPRHFRDRGALSLVTLNLTTEQRAEFLARLAALTDEYVAVDDANPEGVATHRLRLFASVFELSD